MRALAALSRFKIQDPRFKTMGYQPADSEFKRARGERPQASKASVLRDDHRPLRSRQSRGQGVLYIRHLADLPREDAPVLNLGS